MNMTELSKSEFLSFLYAEKSRELENNQVPGWSKWALWGVVATLLVNIYRIIGNIDQDINNLLVAQNSVYCLALLLMWLDTLLTIKARTYNSGKIRRLIDEAPIYAYIIRCILSIAGFVLLIICGYHWAICLSWFLGLCTSTYVIIYIAKNKNNLTQVRWRKMVFRDDRLDVIILTISNFTYFPVCWSFPIQKLDLLDAEFEIAFCLIIALAVISVIVNMRLSKDRKAFELDRIIDRFIIGTINQEDAYSQYILLYYGANIGQAIEKELACIPELERTHEAIKAETTELRREIDAQPITLKDYFRMKNQILLARKQYKKIYAAFKMLFKRIDEIQEMGLPQAAIEEMSKYTMKINMAGDKLMNIQDELIDILQRLHDDYFKDRYCPSHRVLCHNYLCHRRNIKPTIRIFIKMFVWKMTHGRLPKNYCKQLKID